MAGVLAMGLIVGPSLLVKSQSNFAYAQAPPAGKQKHVTLIASEKEVQVAPDNALASWRDKVQCNGVQWFNPWSVSCYRSRR